MSDTERRFAQHEQDLREIYEMLTSINDRITSVAGTALAQKTRLDALERGQQEENERLTALEQGLQGTNERLTSLEQSVQVIDGKLDQVLAALATWKQD